MPFISIVIPVYNRAHLVRRTLDSCLAQEFRDFEVIVVDDGSIDGSFETIQTYGDRRIHSILHQDNLGVFAARNTGVDAASGDWVVCLDSDDELMPDALLMIHQKSLQVTEDVAGMRFACLMGDGSLSPYPALLPEIWDYRQYIMWLESVHKTRGESLVVVRRWTFESVKYPEGRGTELLYHLDFARRFLTHQFPDIVRRYHQDAPNQLTKPDSDRQMKEAVDTARTIQRLLARHGTGLARWAPSVHLALTSRLAFEHFLAGRRLNGLTCAARCLLQRPTLLQTWAIAALGLVGPRALTWSQTQRARIRQA